VDWLCRLTGADGHRLADRSVRNAVLPLQSCLRRAARAGLLRDGVEPMVVPPRRRRGRAYEFDERRFLTRQQLTRLLAEIPDDWRPLFELLASTGLRISEAIALRVIDADLETDQPRIQVRRAIVNGQLTGPKSRHGRRTIPISHALAKRLAALTAERGEGERLFVGAQGAALRPGNVRYRVMIPAAERAGVPWARFHTLIQPPRYLARLTTISLSLVGRGPVHALPFLNNGRTSAMSYSATDAESIAAPCLLRGAFLRKV
jgi:integrase